MIKEFKNENRWLSNFTPVKIILDNKTYMSVEHAYMSAKSDDIKWKNFCLTEKSPGKIKQASKFIILSNRWTDSFRLKIMEDLLRLKFNQEPFKSKLIATKNQTIQEGNNWNDTFFGICLKSGKGKNHLGRLIMKIRAELINEESK